MKPINFGRICQTHALAMAGSHVNWLYGRRTWILQSVLEGTLHCSSLALYDTKKFPLTTGPGLLIYKDSLNNTAETISTDFMRAKLESDGSTIKLISASSFIFPFKDMETFALGNLDIWELFSMTHVIAQKSKLWCLKGRRKSSGGIIMQWRSHS